MAEQSKSNDTAEAADAQRSQATAEPERPGGVAGLWRRLLGRYQPEKRYMRGPES